MVNGGIVSIAYLIARYVDPQTRYIEANAAMICARVAWVRRSLRYWRSRGVSVEAR